MNRSIIDDQRTNAVQLGAEELQRYSRHLIMPEVTADGQRRIKAARVLCIGAGGLGSPAALYLAAAGVGTIGIVDFDDVDLSNLQRQILHGTKDVGRGKLESAQDRLRDINPKIEIELYQCRLSSENASEIVSKYDIVVISPRVTCPTMSAFSSKSQMCTARCSDSRGKLPYLRLIGAARVIAAFFRSHLPRSRFRTVRKRVSSAFCPA
jgi:ThiF family